MSGRRYDWVFLDVGETLLRVSDPPPEYAAVLAELGYPLRPERMLAAFNQARRAAFATDHLGPGPEYAVSRERAAARRGRFVAALVRAIGVAEADLAAARAAIDASLVGTVLFGLYPDVLPALEALRRRGYRLGVVSNWEPRLELLCRNHGLGEYVAFVVASEAEGYAKPSARLFRRALELAGAEPWRVVHVGDSFEHDVRGATGVGIDAVLLDRGDFYEAGLWNPTIRSLAALPGAIEPDQAE